MSTTIESLQVEVQSSATSAVSGIDALASSLGKLKSATKGGVGLTAVAKQLTTLNNALNGISGANADNLNKLAQGLQTLSSCGNLKLSSSVPTQITNIGTAVKSLSGTDFSVLSRLANSLTPLENVGKSNLNSFISQLQRLPQAVQALNSVNMGGLSSKLAELVSALSQLSNMGKNNLTSFVTQLNKIPKLMENLKNVDMRTLYNQIQSLVRVFTPLATQMEKVSAGFAAFPTRIQRLIADNEKLATSNAKTGTSYVNLAAKIGIAYVALTRIARVVASFIVKSNQYVEDLNLFTASMGKYADEAKKYAESVADIIGIDPAEWLRNQGIFMTLATGFCVVSDRAYIMSQNLTQLGYDISSFFNISFADSMQKLQSGIAGELEPLRRLGYDLSVARLQQEAYTLGIKKKISAMTQAEKAELRYYAIMTQVTVAQGDMARTLIAPANQIRILQAQVTQCARALGNIFIPALNAVLPYAIALAKVIRMVADVISSLFGFSLPEIDYSGLNGAAGGADDVANGLGDATKKAKELKKALIGIDELNVLSPPEDSDSGTGIGGAGGLGFELPTYDFINDAVTSKIDEIVQKMKEWLGIADGIDSWAEFFDTRLGKILLAVGAIGAGLAAWKIAKGITDFFKTISSFKGFNISLASIGGLGLLSDLNEFIKYFKDFVENGATFQNVTGMISEFAGAIGDSMIILGNVKVGGALKVAQGIGEIAVAIKDISESGVNWDNANTAIRGLTNIAIGIGVFTGNLKVAAWGLAIQGFTAIITEIGDNWNAIKQGDWSGVDVATLAIGALEVLGGLAIALDVFSKLKGVVSIGKSAEAVKTVSDATGNLSNTVSTGLSPNLSTLTKNLGMGIVIVAEVAAAALLITGAIILLGMELEQVGIAWQPVIDNGGTVAAAMGIGVGILAAIGVVTALLGSVGTPLIVNIALGVAILAELGIAAGLFLIEIWAIGKGLDEIGKAWQPVLDNGDTIAKGIGLGTALLVGIGVVTAALGVATVASAGLLPLAIGLGTAILVELAIAVVLFIESLVAVAKELGNNLAPALDDLNGKLPGLTTDMSDFVDFMTAFAGEVVRYTGASAVAGLSATIDTIIGWFTQDPIEKMKNDVEKIAGQVKELNDKLNVAVPELKTAVGLLAEYVDFVDKLGTVAGSSGTVKLSEGLKVNLKTVGENIVTGFNEGVKNKYSTIQTTITNWGSDVQKWFNNSSFGGVNKEKFATYANDIVNGFKDKISSSSGNTKSSITSWATNLKTWFTSSSFGGINKETFEKYANDIVNGFKNGIVGQSESAKSGMTTWANNTKKYFTDIVSSSTFYDIAKDVIKGFNNGINDFYDLSRSYMRRWANDAKETFKEALDSNSPSKVFEQIGGDTVLGYNLGISRIGKTTRGVVNTWADSFVSVSPVMSFAVDTSALRYYSSDSFAKSVSANVTSNSSVAVSGFKEGMEEFYREYIEPTMSQMAEDMRRQADKNEQTIVQVGNRVVSDAVTTQQKANGYVFAK
ncbi:MAG: hypothetical protein LBN40_04470 [Oscillospiraceae bacterium]|jgi:hypothetical protein|nr:hypothetical protein [Oscillospiraceae bacterium]